MYFFEDRLEIVLLGRIIKHFESIQFMLFWIDEANFRFLSAGKMWSVDVYWTTWRECS